MNSEIRKTRLSTHVFYIAVLMIVSGYALGISGNAEPDRGGFFRRLGNWIGVAKLFFEPPPPMPVPVELDDPETQAEIEEMAAYQSLPNEFVNLPVTRSVGENGEPIIDHASGW